MDKDDIFISLITIFSIVSLIIVTIGIGYLIKKNITCPRYASSVDLEGKFDFWAGGCFVKYDGQWVPKDNLRAGKLD